MGTSKTTQSMDLKPSSEHPSGSAFLIFSFVLMLMLSIAVLLPLYPNDFWPYLRIGEEITRTGAIPTTEFMTYTQFGQPAVYLYWLPSVIFLKLYQWGGVLLIGAMAAVCIAAFTTLNWLCLRELGAGPLVSGFVLLLTAVVGINYWATRPQLLTYPLFGVVLLAVLRWLRGENRLIWLIPLAAALWANFHGSFIIIFFILVPALIVGSGSRTKLALVTLLSLGATCLNRYGIGLWTSMFSMVNDSSIKTFSVEWRLPANEDWQSNIFFATLLILPALAAVFRPKIKLLYWIWYLGFGWMALSAARYGVWFLPVEGFLLVMLLKPFFDRFLENSQRFQNRVINTALGVLLLVAPLFLLPGVRAAWWTQSPPVLSETTPVQATRWLEQHPDLPGELWSDFTYATYLAYTLPERKLFTTNRFEDFPVQQFEENKRIADADADWQQLLTKYNVRVLMVSLDRQPDLVEAASQSESWLEVYRDEQTVIFSSQEALAFEEVRP